MKVFNLIVLFFLVGCNDLNYTSVNEYKVILINTQTILKYDKNKKYYYSFQERKDKGIIYPTNCQIGLMYKPKNMTSDLIAVANVIEKLKHYKIDLNDKNYQYFKKYELSKDIIGMVNVMIVVRRQFWFLFITQECLQVSGIPITKEQLEELEQQGAIYDE